MKKLFILFSASIMVLFVACAQDNSEKTTPDINAKVDSAQEQKNLDSLFNAASKNVESSKDTLSKN